MFRIAALDFFSLLDGKRDILEKRKPREKAVILKDDAPFGGRLFDFLSVPGDSPFIWFGEPSKKVQQGGLAAAAFAQQTHEFTLIYFQVDVFQDGLAIVRKTEIRCFKTTLLLTHVGNSLVSRLEYFFSVRVKLGIRLLLAEFCDGFLVEVGTHIFSDLLVGLDEFSILQEIPKEFDALHVRIGILRDMTAVERLVDKGCVELDPLGNNFHALLVVILHQFFGFD